MVEGLLQSITSYDSGVPLMSKARACTVEGLTSNCTMLTPYPFHKRKSKVVLTFYKFAVCVLFKSEGDFTVLLVATSTISMDSNARLTKELCLAISSSIIDLAYLHACSSEKAKIHFPSGTRYVLYLLLLIPTI